MVITPLLLMLLILPHFAFAAEESKSSADIMRDLVTILNTFFQFLQFLLYPLLMIIAALMDNEMLIGPAMENKLRLIWVEIRNWVNIAFVLVMVGIAFYNVMGIAGDGSNFALKSILPKIVIGLVAVNFSFLAGKLMIDSTAVLTNAVYALPSSGNLMDWDEQRDEMKVRLCAKPGEEDGDIVYTEGTATTRNTDDGSMLASIFCATGEGGETFTGEFNAMGNNFFNHFGQHNVSVALMVQMGNAANLQVPKEGGAQAIADLSFSLLFNIFLFVMFGFAYAALAVVLIARVIVLWICLALSPLAVLLFIFPDLSNAAGGGNFDIKEKFFGHLFVPLVIGVVFSIGFTMLSTLKGTSAGGWLGQIGDKGLNDIGTLDQAIELGTTFGNDLSNFQDLLIAIAAVLIIWMGTFAAAEKTVANSITSSIKTAGETTGKFIAKLPAYATVIPGKFAGEDDVNVMSALGGIIGAPRAWERKMNKRDGISNKLAGANTKVDDVLDKMRDATHKQAGGYANDHFKEKGSLDVPAEVKQVVDHLAGRLSDSNKEGLNLPPDKADLSKWLKHDASLPQLETLFGRKITKEEREGWGETAPSPEAPATDGAAPAAGTPAAARTDAVVQAFNPAAGARNDQITTTDIGKINVALNTDEVTPEMIVNSPAVDHTDVTPEQATAAYTRLKGMKDTERQPILQQITLKDGKIPTKDLIAAFDAADAAATPSTDPATP
jgi:hypothetical protein